MKDKSPKIYMQDWLYLHTYPQSGSDDQWYLNFAQSLIPIFKKSELLREFSDEEYKDLAVVCSVYFEDAVSEGGGWSRFRNEIKRLYDCMLPFYKVDSATYFEDEINVQDLQFIIWSFLSCPQDEMGDDYILVDPFDEELIALAATIFDALDEAFEDAPVTKGESADWIMDMDQLKETLKPVPSVDIDSCTSASAKHMLKAQEGYPLAFIETYQELTSFFIDVLKWEDKKDSLMPEMSQNKNFVVYANARGILIAPEVAVYFDAPKNPLYQADLSKEESYLLFVEQGSCPFDLLKYAVQEGYLNHAALPFENGKQILDENRDFISRWYLGEYYEGK